MSEINTNAIHRLSQLTLAASSLALVLAACSGGSSSETGDQPEAAAQDLASDSVDMTPAAEGEADTAPDDSAENADAAEDVEDKADASAEEKAKEAKQPADKHAETAAKTETKAVASGPLPQPASFAQCKVCHAVKKGQPGGFGPTLHGVIGRKSAGVSGFRYSPAMQQAGLVWSRANLDKFLKSPQATVQGTTMAFPGVADAAKRKEIIDYLASLK